MKDRPAKSYHFLNAKHCEAFGRLPTRPHVSGLAPTIIMSVRLMLRVGLLALGHMWAKEILPHDVRGYASFDRRKDCVVLAFAHAIDHRMSGASPERFHGC